MGKRSRLQMGGWGGWRCLKEEEEEEDAGRGKAFLFPSVITLVLATKTQ